MSFTTNKGLNDPADGTQNWGTILNSNFTIIDNAFGSTTTITLSNGSAVTLTQTQYQNFRVLLSGVVSTTASITIPTGISGFWIVANSLSGGGVLTVSSGGGGASVTVPQAQNYYIFSDGSAIYTISASGGGATGGGTDAIFFNNGQTVTTSYSIPASTNAGTFGPVTINSGATVTIPSSSTWTVV